MAAATRSIACTRLRSGTGEVPSLVAACSLSASASTARARDSRESTASCNSCVLLPQPLAAWLVPPVATRARIRSRASAAAFPKSSAAAGMQLAL